MGLYVSSINCSNAILQNTFRKMWIVSVVRAYFRMHFLARPWPRFNPLDSHGIKGIEYIMETPRYRLARTLETLLGISIICSLAHNP
ncbi:hypothetical protein RHMOL_Rhmol12G0154200 [Rhododendron molle]|uniref:Uncharacterized protein n=1 Tax=Rhododendron molle TaxID=49168 RepID=A0ACC0LJG8_RHOML|nr:hypothetical protein RHMOL_Rhmol12G0154200 [Rhododendron molle]